MNFKDKVVIVTGAGSGIGAATAKLFSEKGAHVVVSDINEVNGLKTLELILSDKGSACFIKTDVSNYKDFESLINKAVKDYSMIDVLVNNAGIGNQKLVKTDKHSIEEWDKVIAVNQTGVFYGMQLALREMLKQGHGNIVNIASLAGLVASGNNIAYSASKFAVVGMTKSAALEYASKNIRINAVCPGYTQSGLLDQVFEDRPDMKDKLLNATPMKRFGQPNEIAQAVLWLASENTSFITGQTITLDGGISL